VILDIMLLLPLLLPGIQSRVLVIAIGSIVYVAHSMVHVVSLVFVYVTLGRSVLAKLVIMRLCGTRYVIVPVTNNMVFIRSSMVYIQPRR